MAEEIATLNAKITDLEVERNKHRPDSQAFTNYTNEIVAIRNEIVAIRNEIVAIRNEIIAKGNLSSVCSIVRSQSSRCNPLPNLFRHILFCNSSNSAIIP